MEDYATATLRLPLPHHLPQTIVDYFGVFDGHGGSSVARFASRALHKHIVTHAAFEVGDVVNAIRWGFFNADNAVRIEDLSGSEACGSTACVCVIRGDTVYIGNAGDSRAVLSIKGVAKALSVDHKPILPAETARIKKAGGDVFEGRVMGELAVSRSLGDFRFKANPRLGLDEQLVSSEPEVTVHELSDDDEFLLLACDGIWDVLGNQETVDFVRHRLKQGLAPSEILDSLIDRCIPPKPTDDARGMDNMTIILILFKSSSFYPRFLRAASGRWALLQPADQQSLYSGIFPAPLERDAPTIAPFSNFDNQRFDAPLPSSSLEERVSAGTAAVPRQHLGTENPDPAFVHTKEHKLMAVSLPASLGNSEPAKRARAWTRGDDGNEIPPPIPQQRNGAELLEDFEPLKVGRAKSVGTQPASPTAIFLANGNASMNATLINTLWNIDNPSPAWSGDNNSGVSFSDPYSDSSLASEKPSNALEALLQNSAQLGDETLVQNEQGELSLQSVSEGLASSATLSISSAGDFFPPWNQKISLPPLAAGGFAPMPSPRVRFDEAKDSPCAEARDKLVGFLQGLSFNSLASPSGSSTSSAHTSSHILVHKGESKSADLSRTNPAVADLSRLLGLMAQNRVGSNKTPGAVQTSATDYFSFDPNIGFEK